MTKNEALAELAAARSRLKALEVERNEARKFGEDAAKQYNALLREHETVTCAFCGRFYPRGTPRHGDGTLAEHIKTCPEHPMRALEAERDRLSEALKVIYTTARGDEKSECWTIRKWLNKRDVFNDDIQGSERLIALACKAALAGTAQEEK